MKRILFVVSNLRTTGPTRQLFYILKYLNRAEFCPAILTLSPEKAQSMDKEISTYCHNIRCLDLSRSEWLFSGHAHIKNHIDKFSPDVIHTQGIRADIALAKIPALKTKWIATLRNNLFEDYSGLFGYWKGMLFAHLHASALRKCLHVVACSRSIKKFAVSKKMACRAILNGVELATPQNTKMENSIRQLERPIFIYSGSLIARKNVEFLIDGFVEYLKLGGPGSLLLLGDGPQAKNLQRKEIKRRINFLGMVREVSNYLNSADIFVSMSKSEGLPNSVLESLAVGTPCILSNIPAHEEIKEEVPDAVTLFNLEKSPKDLSKVFFCTENIIKKVKPETLSAQATSIFSALAMSENYQIIYQEIGRK